MSVWPEGAPQGPPAAGEPPLVVVIDDDEDILDAMAALLTQAGLACRTHTHAKACLDALVQSPPPPEQAMCVLCDVRLPDIDGLALQASLKAFGDPPIVLMSGASGAFEAASGFRAGAVDFLLKPIEAERLLDAVHRGLTVWRQRHDARRRRDELHALAAGLSAREMAVARLIVAGLTQEGIAMGLGITPRTVKFHRQRLFGKLGIASLPELVRLLDAFDRQLGDQAS